MNFKRKIYDRILQWKASRNGRTALLVEGARRVGKSFTVAEFAGREYKSHVIVDFSSPQPLTLDAILNAPHDLDGLFNRISLEYHELSGRAKDIGSALVFCTFFGAGICWALVVTGILVRKYA